MILYTRVALILVSMMLSVNAFSRGDIPIESGSAFLVEACREVVEIYDNKKEAKLLASQRTSLNEGIKAGYCMGVTVQYLEQAGYCQYAKHSWFEIARSIADSKLSDSRLRRIATSELLEEAYCGI